MIPQPGPGAPQGGPAQSAASRPGVPPPARSGELQPAADRSRGGAGRLGRDSFELEALGTTRANESVDITAKVVNQVTAVRFTEGQQVSRGQVLVELDAAQVRADLAAAEAALAESRSQYKRSRELYTTRCFPTRRSSRSRRPTRATRRASPRRVLASTTRSSARRSPAVSACARISVGSLISPGTVITTLDDTSTVKLDFTIPETFLSAVQPGLEITAHSVAYPDTTVRAAR